MTCERFFFSSALTTVTWSAESAHGARASRRLGATVAFAGGAAGASAPVFSSDASARPRLLAEVASAFSCVEPGKNCAW